MSSRRQTGAEFFLLDSASNGSLVELQVLNSAGGFYETRNVKVSDFRAPEFIQVSVPTITGQSDAVTVLFTAPFAGKVTKVEGTISGAITGSNIVITPSVYKAGSGTAITDGAVTIAYTGSGVSTSASATPTAANSFDKDDVVTAAITGGTGAVGGLITIVFERS